MGRPSSAAATAAGQPIVVVASLDGGFRMGAVRSQGDAVLVHEPEAAPVRYPLDAVCHTHESAVSAAGAPVVDALLGGMDAVLLCCGGGVAAQQAALFGSPASEQPTPSVPHQRAVPTIEAQLQAAPTQAERAVLAAGTAASSTAGGAEGGAGGGAAAWVCRRLLERLHRLAGHSAADGLRRRFELLASLVLLHADTPRDLLPASNEPPLQPGAKLPLPPVKLHRSGGRGGGAGGVHLSGAREARLTREPQ